MASAPNPLVTPQFKLQMFVNDQEVEIGRNSFNSFIIYELQQYNCYYAVLILNDISKNFKNDCFATGEKLKFKVKFEDEDKSEYESEFRVVDTKLIQNETYAVSMIPEIFYVMNKEKLNFSYKEKFNNVVDKAFNNVKTGTWKSEIDSVQGKSDIFLQVNESYFNFIRRNYQEACYDKYADFSFFISKDNILKLKSLSKIANSDDPIDYIPDTSLLNTPKIYNSNFDQQLFDGGLGSTVFYFDWENGDMIEKKLDKSKITGNYGSMFSKTTKKIGVNEDLITEENESFMGSPIGDKDLFPDEMYNEKMMESLFLRKNIYSLFINFMYRGNIKYTPLKLVNYGSFNPAKSAVFSSVTSGNYYIYNVIHILTLTSYTVDITLANPFLFDWNDSKIK